MARDVFWIALVVVLILLLVLLLGGAAMGFGMIGPGMMGGNGFGWWGIGMGILMLLFWALIIGGVVLLILWIVRQERPATSGSRAGGERALDILRERYARGELTREEYEQMRQDLRD